MFCINKHLCYYNSNISWRRILPPNFSGKNAYGSGYAIVLKLLVQPPYWNVSGLITTDTPLKIASSIRYDLLGRAMQEAGVDSGMSIKAANQIDGL